MTDDGRGNYPPLAVSHGAPENGSGAPPDKRKKGKGKGGQASETSVGSARDAAVAAAAGEGGRGNKVLEDVWSWLEPVSVAAAVLCVGMIDG